MQESRMMDLRHSTNEVELGCQERHLERSCDTRYISRRGSSFSSIDASAITSFRKHARYIERATYARRLNVYIAAAALMRRAIGGN